MSLSISNKLNCKANLAKSKYFSTLDANLDFWMLPLDEELSKLCTFICPFGRWRFKTLPFGTKSVPELFHAAMVENLKDIAN